MLFQRIQPEYIKGLIYKLSDVIHKLDVFIHINMVVSQLTFQQVEFALTKMVKSVAVPDVNFMRQILTDHQAGYSRSYDQVVDRVMMLMDDVFSNLREFSNEATNIEFNLPVTVSIRLLDASLESLLSVDLFGGGTTVKNAPSRLLNDGVHWVGCQQLMEDVKAFLNRILPYNDSTWRNETANLTRFSLGHINDLHRRLSLYKCAGAFAADLNSLVNTFDELDREIIDFNNAFALYDAEYLNATKTHINDIRDTKMWFLEQLSLYSKNRTTQIKLATQITESKLSDVSQSLDLVISIVKSKALKRLQLATDNINDNLKGWYGKALTAMTILAPYYDDTIIEDKIRVLKLWRHPVARLATSDILQFKYTTSESWHSWKASLSLQDFVRSGDATAVVWTIMEDYSRVLRNELLKFEMQFNTAKYDIIKAFREIMNHFSHIYSESLVDEHFVRWVFLQ